MHYYFENPVEEWPEDYIQQLPYSFQEVYQTNVDDTRNRFDRINKIFNPGAESKARFSQKMFCYLSRKGVNVVQCNL